LAGAALDDKKVIWGYLKNKKTKECG
jgi:hypothetical protein